MTQITNPNSIRKVSKEEKIRHTTIGELLTIVQDYITIIIAHDQSKTRQPWYNLWTAWTEAGILSPKTTIRTVVVIIDLPESKHLSIKALGLHILDSLPALQRYPHIPWKTKHNSPIVYYTKPMVATGTQWMPKSTPTASNKMTPGDTNPFSAFAEEMEDPSPLGDSIEELEEEDDDEPLPDISIDEEASTTTTSTNLNSKLELTNTTMDSVLLTTAGVKIPDNRNDKNNKTTTTVAKPQLSTIAENAT